MKEILQMFLIITQYIFVLFVTFMIPLESEVYFSVIQTSLGVILYIYINLQDFSHVGVSLCTNQLCITIVKYLTQASQEVNRGVLWLMVVDF